MTVSTDFLYRYKAKVTDVYDGDTVTVDIDLGLGVWMHNQRIRLHGINAPEIRGDERELGMVSRDWLREKILDQEVMLKTYKDKTGKFGRWLAEIYLNGMNVNKAMVLRSLAKEALY